MTPTARPRRAVRERVEGLQPEQQVDRPGRHLGDHQRALGLGLARTARACAGRPVGVVVVLGEGERRSGRPMAAASLRIQAISRSGAARSSPSAPAGRQLEHAGAEPRPARRRCRTARPRRRRCRARAHRRWPCGRWCGTWRSRARRRPSALLDDGGHGRDVLGGGGLVPGAPLPHHVGPHRAVGDLGADVERLGRALHGVEVLGEGLPVPADALGQRGAGDVLDALHQADQPLVAVRVHRREADAAVAHDHGGDAVPARRREQRVPGDLAVEVGVDVDEAGGDQQAVGVEVGGWRGRRPRRPR